MSTRPWRPASLLAALALLPAAAACGADRDDALWSLDGRTVSGGGHLRPTTWATGSTLAVTRPREVTGYDAATGEPRWAVPLPGGVCTASARPAGGRVAVQFGRGEFGCERIAVLDLRNGTKLWERPITGERHRRGQVVIAGDTVVVDWLYGTAAFHLADGRPRWTTDSQSADCAIQGMAGGPALVAGRSCDADKGRVGGVHGIDPRTGRYLWTYDAPPGYVVDGMLSSSPVVLGLRLDGRRERAWRVAVLNPSGAQTANFDIQGTVRCSVDSEDPTRCEHAVVTEDTLYVRSGAGPKRGRRFAPIVAFDLATGRVRWGTDNPDGNHLFPVAMDGGRLIAAQPGAFAKGRGKPPRLVSVDPATGKTTIMWGLTRKADFPLRSGSYRQYAGGRFFLTKHLITGKEEVALHAYGPDGPDDRGE
ncbi:PQQ-binding-like beta-propeller repeat protein [Actinomadura sp. 6K520]|uniref:outer membrane protein assembly factor BamB family protein n=1 Tax=Actinomadura sp. 6K520 TaxID=2530364 RepID=UPI001404436F|nr:PQQ-binding-like beta-propeller repeat protein [Actinomadura sp. 6K520]